MCGGDLATIALTDRHHALAPSREALEWREERGRGRRRRQEGNGIVDREVGQADLLAEQEVTAVGELGIEGGKRDAQLIELRRERALELPHVETARQHFLSIVDELLREQAGSEE